MKESARKCSHCGNNGHNSRTCSGLGGAKGGLKLFGVKILTEKDDDTMRKSFSMGNLQSCNVEHHYGDAGYLSDGLLQSRRGKRAHERKKGIPLSFSVCFLRFLWSEWIDFSFFLIQSIHVHPFQLFGFLVRRWMWIIETCLFDFFEDKNQIFFGLCWSRGALVGGRASDFSSWIGKAGKGGLERNRKTICDYQNSNPGCQPCPEIFSPPSCLW